MSAINRADEKSRCDCNTFGTHCPRDPPVIKRQVEKTMTGASVIASKVPAPTLQRPFVLETRAAQASPGRESYAS